VKSLESISIHVTTIAIKLSGTEQTQVIWKDLAQSLRTDLEVEFVDCKNDSIELLLAVRSSNADALVLFAEQDTQAIMSHLFAEFPDITVLTLRSSGQAYIDERCHVRRELSDCTNDGVLQALHRALEHPCNSDSVLADIGAALHG